MLNFDYGTHLNIRHVKYVKCAVQYLFDLNQQFELQSTKIMQKCIRETKTKAKLKTKTKTKINFVQRLLRNNLKTLNPNQWYFKSPCVKYIPHVGMKIHRLLWRKSAQKSRDFKHNSENSGIRYFFQRIPYSRFYNWNEKIYQGGDCVGNALSHE